MKTKSGDLLQEKTKPEDLLLLETKSEDLLLLETRCEDLLLSCFSVTDPNLAGDTKRCFLIGCELQ